MCSIVVLSLWVLTRRQIAVATLRTAEAAWTANSHRPKVPLEPTVRVTLAIVRHSGAFRIRLLASLGWPGEGK
jgi:hypothetical protein